MNIINQTKANAYVTNHNNTSQRTVCSKEY